MINTSTLIASLLVFLINDLYKSKTSVRVKTKMLKWMLTVIESLWDRTVLRVTERTCAWLSFFLSFKGNLVKGIQRTLKWQYEHNNNKSNTNRPSIVSHSTTEHSKQAIKRYIFDVPSEYPNKKRDKNTGLIFKCFKADSNLKFKKKEIISSGTSRPVLTLHLYRGACQP